jgi:hypothetical protein
VPDSKSRGETEFREIQFDPCLLVFIIYSSLSAPHLSLRFITSIIFLYLPYILCFLRHQLSFVVLRLLSTLICIITVRSLLRLRSILFIDLKVDHRRGSDSSEWEVGDRYHRLLFVYLTLNFFLCFLSAPILVSYLASHLQLASSTCHF